MINNIKARRFSFSIFLWLSLVILLGGCGQVDRQVAAWTGTAETCHAGVTYIQFTSGVTVKYNPDGTIASCNK